MPAADQSVGSERRGQTLRRAGEVSMSLLLIIAACAAGVIALIELRLIVIPLMIALFAATMLEPPTSLLERRGLPRWAATAFVMLVSILGIAAIGGSLAPTVADEFSQVDLNVRAGAERVVDWLRDTPLEVDPGEVDHLLDRVYEAASSNRGVIADNVISGAALAIEVATGAVLALFSLFFILKDGRAMWEWLGSWFAPTKRPHINEAGQRAWVTLGRFLRGLALTALVDAIAIGVGLALLGVPLALPLAVLTFFLAFIPIVGAMTAGIAAMLVALVDAGITSALLVGLLALAVQQIEGDVIYPLVVGRAIRMHPLAILMAVTAGVVLGGIIGALFAVPLTAVAYSIASYARERELRGVVEPVL